MDVVIRILGRDSNEVGDHLELLTKELFAKLGFGSFISNAYKTGAEIDLKARHRVTGAPLLCECKARSKTINTPDVRKFYAEWEKERKADSRLYGIVISTAGYAGTAKQWYEELDAETRQNFDLMEPDKLLLQLVDAGFTLDPQAIDLILGISTQKVGLGSIVKS